MANKYRISLIFVIINAPLTIFFFDYFNLNVTIYGASYLYLGMGPYMAGNQIVAAYMILPYNLLTFIIYLLSSFSVFFTYISLKIVGLVFIYMIAIVLWKTIARNTKIGKTLLIGTIVLNPFLIIFNDISLSTVFIPIFFTLLSYYMLFECKFGENTTTAIGVFALLIATFTYYFPILVVPSYLIYQQSNRRRIKFIFFLIAEGTLLFVPSQFFHLSSSFAGTVVSGSASLYPYSVFNLLPQFSQTILLKHQIFITLAIIIMSLVFPLILKKAKFSLSFSVVLVLLVSLLLQPSGTYPDSFLVLLPFEVVILSRAKEPTFTYLNSLIPQLFMIPLLVIEELLNGPGYVTGVFYWLYTILHKNIVIYNLIPYPKTTWELLVALTIVLALWGIIFLIKSDLTRISETDVNDNNRYVNPKRQSHDKVFSSIAILLIVVFFLLFPVTVPSMIPDSNPIVMQTQFPSMLFTPVTNTDVYLMPSPNTYQISGDTIQFSTAASQIYIERNLTNQNFDSRIIIGGYNSSLIPTQLTSPVLASNQFTISLLNTANINNSTNALVPISKQNVTAENVSFAAAIGNPETKGNIPDFLLNSNSTLTYNLESVINESGTLLFSIEFSNYSSIQNTIWRIYNGQNTIKLFIVNSSLYLSSNNANKTDTTKNTVTKTGNFSLNKWYVGAISFSKQKENLAVFFDGFQSSTRFFLGGHNSTKIVFGKNSTPSNYNGKYAVNDNISVVYTAPNMSSIFTKEIIVSNLYSQKEYSVPYSESINIEMSSTSFNTTLTVNNISFKFHPELKYIEFGKITQNELYLTYKFLSLRITADSIIPNFLLITLSLTVIGPAIFIILPLQLNITRCRKYHQ